MSATASARASSSADAGPAGPCDDVCSDVDACRHCLHVQTKAIERQIDAEIAAFASPESLPRLRADQTAWKKRRDEECDLDAHLHCLDTPITCGTMASDMFAGCIRHASEERLAKWKRNRLPP